MSSAFVVHLSKGLTFNERTKMYVEDRIMERRIELLEQRVFALEQRLKEEESDVDSDEEEPPSDVGLSHRHEERSPQDLVPHIVGQGNCPPLGHLG